jgi:hypothetical protein
MKFNQNFKIFRNKTILKLIMVRIIFIKLFNKSCNNKKLMKLMNKWQIKKILKNKKIYGYSIEKITNRSKK